LVQRKERALYDEEEGEEERLRRVDVDCCRSVVGEAGTGEAGVQAGLPLGLGVVASEAPPSPATLELVKVRRRTAGETEMRLAMALVMSRIHSIFSSNSGHEKRRLTVLPFSVVATISNVESDPAHTHHRTRHRTRR
jgi:hypothetical protein